jgi:hypothetical protein
LAYSIADRQVAGEWTEGRRLPGAVEEVPSFLLPALFRSQPETGLGGAMMTADCRSEIVPD